MNILIVEDELLIALHLEQMVTDRGLSSRAKAGQGVVTNCHHGGSFVSIIVA